MDNIFKLIFDQICEKLTNSKKIKDFIDTNYTGYKFNLFNGLLEEVKPDQSKYPAVMLSEVLQYSEGDNSRTNDYIIEVGAALKNDTKFGESFYEETAIAATPEKPESLVHVLPGKVSIEEFWSIIISELLTLKGLYNKIEFVGTAKYNEVHPIFSFSSTYKLSFRRNMRGPSH